jgi:uncharacterized repeat protein (TIGR03806 family)
VESTVARRLTGVGRYLTPTSILLLTIGAAGCSSKSTGKSDAAVTSDGSAGAGGHDGGATDARHDGSNASSDAASDAASDRRTDAGTDGSAAAVACAPPADPDQPLQLLSQTGCMDSTTPTAFASVVVPYVVNSPLWSDGADKSRGMRLPPGGKIHVKHCTGPSAECLDAADDGKWVFPVGTVMVKSFLFNGKLIETRLFTNHDAGDWVGYSYAWNTAQTEATIVPDQRTEVSFDDGTGTPVDWHYPSRLDCITCHTPTGGDTLGPSTAQMNRVNAGATQNQLDLLQAMNLFDAPIPTPYKAALPTPYTSQVGNQTAGATTAQLARSYLAANCAFCHRPDDPNFPSMDFRYDVAFADMGICGVAPMKGDEGVNNSLLLAPAQPSDSVVWLRMDATVDNGRMPKVASYVIDQNAVSLVSSWITSITSCPAPTM